MDIKAKFLELTSKTYPLGTEKQVYKFLPEDFIKDKYDNLYWIIGKPDTMFTAHLDTVDMGQPGKIFDVKHVIEGDMIKTNGETILGADDKAGVVIMLYMIEQNIPGFYLFTVGEEKGCVGSSNLSKALQSKMEDKFKGIKKIIAFDRSGYNNIITHQMEQRCCSDEFAAGLASEFGKLGLKYQLDPTGVYCDSAEFADIFPECTNISVGYFDQHSKKERQDIAFLTRLAEACCKVDWVSLPVKRDYKKIEYIDSYYISKQKKKQYAEESGQEFDDYDFHPFAIDDNKDVEVFYFEDKKFKFISDISYLNGKIIDITIATKRIEYELEILANYLSQEDIDYEFVEWDGLILRIDHDNTETKLTRDDLAPFVPELNIEYIKTGQTDVKSTDTKPAQANKVQDDNKSQTIQVGSKVTMIETKLPDDYPKTVYIITSISGNTAFLKSTASNLIGTSTLDNLKLYEN